MAHSTTLNNGSGSQLKPRKDTIKFILDYSKAHKLLKLKQGLEIDLVQN
ncbi:MAG: hypothetical protein U5L96_06325 [Owenweeksia sp.]|nr:hypothetical protein [Owenweeksia sp.]